MKATHARTHFKSMRGMDGCLESMGWDECDEEHGYRGATREKLNRSRSPLRESTEAEKSVSQQQVKKKERKKEKRNQQRSRDHDFFLCKNRRALSKKNRTERSKKTRLNQSLTTGESRIWWMSEWIKALTC